MRSKTLEDRWEASKLDIMRTPWRSPCWDIVKRHVQLFRHSNQVLLGEYDGQSAIYKAAL